MVILECAKCGVRSEQTKFEELEIPFLEVIEGDERWYKRPCPYNGCHGRMRILDGISTARH